MSTTLRNKFHDLGNKINTALLYVTSVKDKLEREKFSESLVGLVHKCQVTEDVLVELDRELSSLKNITYRFMPPDEKLDVFVEEIRHENKAVKILVVDDEEALCEIIKEMYESRGFQVQSASTVEAAQKAVLEFSPNIALLDLYLNSSKDGVEILRFIKKERPETKCLIVTKEDDENELKDVRALNPEEILIKPFAGKQLSAKINGLVALLK